MNKYHLLFCLISLPNLKADAGKTPQPQTDLAKVKYICTTYHFGINLDLKNSLELGCLFNYKSKMRQEVWEFGPSIVYGKYNKMEPFAGIRLTASGYNLFINYGVSATTYFLNSEWESQPKTVIEPFLGLNLAVMCVNFAYGVFPGKNIQSTTRLPHGFNVKLILNISEIIYFTKEPYPF